LVEIPNSLPLVWMLFQKIGRVSEDGLGIIYMEEIEVSRASLFTLHAKLRCSVL